MNKSSTVELEAFRSFAERVAIEAGKILLKYRDNAKIISRKADFHDIATEADIASEKFILGEISKCYPTHAVLAEESGITGEGSDFRWIIDPLDGTREYSRGIPLFNVSMALEYKNELIVSAIYRPISSELFSAGKSLGSHINGKAIHTSDETSLSRIILSTQFPFYLNTDEQIKRTFTIYQNLIKKIYRIRPFMETAANLCWLAAGSYDGYFLTIAGPKWWDVAPGLLIAKEAGATITTLAGHKVTEKNYVTEGILATNGKIHKELIKIINN